MKRHNYGRNNYKQNRHNGNGHNGKNGNDWRVDPEINPYCGAAKINGEVVLRVINNLDAAFDICVTHNIRCKEYLTGENIYPICYNFYVNKRGKLIKPQKRMGKFFKGRNGGRKGLYCNKHTTMIAGGKAIQWCLICNGNFSCWRSRFVNINGKKIPQHNYSVSMQL